MVTIKCPECGESLQVPEKFIGEWGICKYCGKTIHATPQEPNIHKQVVVPTVKTGITKIGSILIFIAFIIVVILTWANRYTPQEVAGATATTSTPPQINKNLPGYKIVSEEDISLGSVPRLRYGVVVEHVLTRTELTEISDQIIKQSTANRKVKAIAIFFYLPESDLSGHYTAGKSEWAPNGVWADAASDSPPRLVVTEGSAIGNILPETIEKIPLPTKKEIWRQLILYEDNGMEPAESNKVVARQYGITEEQVLNIATEALVKGWPMP